MQLNDLWLSLLAPNVGLAADWCNLSPTLPLGRPQSPVLGIPRTYSISDDGRHLAVVFREKPKIIQLHSLENEQPPTSFELSSRQDVDRVEFNFDGDRLAVVAGRDIELLLVNQQQLSHDQTLCSSSRMEQPPKLVGWSQNSKRVFLVRAGNSPEIQIYDISAAKLVASFTLPEIATSPVLNSDGSVFLAFHKENASLWRDGHDGVASIPGKAEQIVVSASGNRIAIVKQNEIRVWSLFPLAKGDRIEGEDFRDAKLSNDGHTLLVDDDYDRTTYSIDERGRVKLGNRLDAISPPALSRNGKYVAHMKGNTRHRDICISQACGRGSKSHPLLRHWFTGYEPEFRLSSTRISEDATRLLNYWPDFKILEAIDAATGIQTWAERVPPLHKLFMSSTGKRCVSIDKQGQLRIHTIEAQPKIESIDLLDAGKDWPFGKRIPHIQFLGESRQLLASSRAGKPRFTLIDAESSEKLWKVDAKKDLQFQRVRLSGDQQAICAVSQFAYHVIDRTGNVFKGRETSANPARWHSSDLPIVVDLHNHKPDSRPFFVDPKTGAAISYTSWDTIDPKTTSGSVCGKMYAAAGRLYENGGDGIEIRSVFTGKKLLSFPVAEDDYSWLKFGHDKKSLLLGGNERLVRFPLSSQSAETLLVHDYAKPTTSTGVDATEGTDALAPLQPSAWETKPFHSIACSAVGWIATGNDKGYLNIWNMHDGQRYAALRVGIDRINVAITQDGKYVAFARSEGEVSVLDLHSILPAHPPAKKQSESFVSNFSF